MPTVSIAAVKQAMGPAQTPVAELYIDWLGFTLACQALEGKRECLKKAFYVSWGCCTEHRELQLRHDELRRRAKEILPEDHQTDTGSIFSQRWWSKVSIDHAYDTVVVE